jgi:hypothetical protein
MGIKALFQSVEWLTLVTSDFAEFDFYVLQLLLQDLNWVGVLLVIRPATIMVGVDIRPPWAFVVWWSVSSEVETSSATAGTAVIASSTLAGLRSIRCGVVTRISEVLVQLNIQRFNIIFVCSSVALVVFDE